MYQIKTFEMLALILKADSEGKRNICVEYIYLKYNFLNCEDIKINFLIEVLQCL